jgi:hypothetical protein
MHIHMYCSAQMYKVEKANHVRPSARFKTVGLCHTDKSWLTYVQVLPHLQNFCVQWNGPTSPQKKSCVTFIEVQHHLHRACPHLRKEALPHL